MEIEVHILNIRIVLLADVLLVLLNDGPLAIFAHRKEIYTKRPIVNSSAIFKVPAVRLPR